MPVALGPAMSQSTTVEPPRITTFQHRFIPAERPTGRLAVVLHGLGDSLAGFTWMPEIMGLPWLNYLLLNAPFPYFFFGYAWFDLEDPAPGVAYSRQQLQALFAELKEQGWHSEDILLFGFSQGCLVSLDFAMRYDEPLAGIVGISGYVLMPEQPEVEIHARAREQAWLVTHGLYDDLLPVQRTHEQIQRLQAAGLPIEWYEFPKEHSIDPDDEIPLLRRWIAARWNEPADGGE